MPRQHLLFLAVPLLLLACRKDRPDEAARRGDKPDLLLVTLDTTRADFVAPEAPDATPRLAELARQGQVFRHAYATAPTTLPSHASMLTGLYPAGHYLHENGRRLPENIPLLQELLTAAGYTTAAFVSGFPLARASGIARGFHHFDDDLPDRGGVERRADRTTDRALAWLTRVREGPMFLWVHYFDPHDPYEPPAPYRARFANELYRGEIAFVDSELGRLLDGFNGRPGSRSRLIVIAGDHGEGLGEHGETHHGYLLYQGTMRVPLLLAGTGVESGLREDPVSVRQIRDTFLEAAGLEGPHSLRRSDPSRVILGEAMEPYLQHRWQPQVMAVGGLEKVILAGRWEFYDLAGDPGESRDLAPLRAPRRDLVRAVRDYPLPSRDSLGAAPRTPEEISRLQSLGYLGGSGPEIAPVEASAPRPADRTHLFPLLDTVSRALGRGDIQTAEPLLESLVQQDPGNLMAWVRLGVVRGQRGDGRGALEALERARTLDGASIEVAQALGLEYLRQGQAHRALDELRRVLDSEPHRLPALLGASDALERTGNLAESAALLDRALALQPSSPSIRLRRGLLRMALGQTQPALADLEEARRQEPDRFDRHLELGVLLLATGRLEEARNELDRALAVDPAEPMALFKRAQASVLLGEADSARWIERALRHASPETRPLVANERLFAPYLRQPSP